MRENLVLMIKLITVSGPRGAGKGTIIPILLKHFGEMIHQIVPCTTRSPRIGETHGKEYFFITAEQFMRYENNDELIYASPLIDQSYRSGTHVSELSKAPIGIVDITTEGAIKLRSLIMEKGGSVLNIFIYADAKQRAKRIKIRQTELSKETIMAMIEKDPTHPNPNVHPEFFHKIENSDGDLQIVSNTLIELVEGFLQLEAA